MKKTLSLLSLLFIASCSSIRYDHLCPNVTIPRDTAYLIQAAGYSDEFQITLTGYDGYCYTDPKGRNFALITPKFLVKRLKDTDVTQVDTGFYVETRKGPPAFLGRRLYQASGDIPQNQQTAEFKGPTAKVRLPSEKQDEFEILLGLDLSVSEYQYNQRTFDVTPRYNIERDPLYIERVRLKSKEEKSSCKSCGN